MSTQQIGVIVGRFQVPMLHEGHRSIIGHSIARHETTVVFVGVSQAYPNESDPLSYEARKRMILDACPTIIVRPIVDVGNADLWSLSLDAAIAEEFPGQSAILYGSRDSFLSVYSGRYEVQELPQVKQYSGTLLRMDAADTVLHSDDFRAGIIHAQMRRAPIPYQTVDLAVILPDGNNVLLGEKKRDAGKYRFIGGFVDVNDLSLEAAVIREGREEVPGLVLRDLRYIASRQIDDWRYRGRKDSIMTAFFVANTKSDSFAPGDDLDAVHVVSLSELPEVLVPGHQPLGALLLQVLS